MTLTPEQIASAPWPHFEDCLTPHDGTVYNTARRYKDTTGRIWVCIGRRAEPPLWTHAVDVPGRPIGDVVAEVGLLQVEYDAFYDATDEELGALIATMTRYAPSPDEH